MKVYGYKRNSEDFVNMQEASLECSLEELEKVISFLQHVKEQHGKVIGKTENCHSHYRDWDREWDKDETDIIVITTNEK